MLVTMQNDYNEMMRFADDVIASRYFVGLRSWWDTLQQIGSNYGYYQHPTKSWLVVKESKLEEAVWVFEETHIQMSTEGKQHLGSVIKVRLSPSKKNCVIHFIESSLKRIKNAFYFILKGLFVLNIFKFLS